MLLVVYQLTLILYDSAKQENDYWQAYRPRVDYAPPTSDEDSQTGIRSKQKFLLSRLNIKSS